MDLLFLHVPKFNNYNRPFNRFSFINFPPVGLLGLADFLRKNDYSTRIIHLGVEKHKYGEIDLGKMLAEHQPAIVGLDLHWHFQAFDVIETAQKIKKQCPDVAIVLGGFTASLFADEILRTFRCIDFVIRGDAEIPLRDLVGEYCSGRAYRHVPNLAFRQGDTVQANPISYVADQKTVDSVCYTDFTLMKDYPTFVSSFSRYLHLHDISEGFQELLLKQGKMYPVFLGRGCVYDCSFCGGSRHGQKMANGRERVCMRSVEAVLESMKDLQRFGFDSACLAFDPLPVRSAEKFYFALFEGMKKENVSLKLEVERYCLPTPEFIRRFRDLPGSGSWITISPYSHNEEVRRKNSLYRYSNAQLEKCLSVMEAEGVNYILYFAAGLPYEQKDDLKEMSRYQRQLRKNFKHAKCRTNMIEIEPGSRLSSNPHAHGITLRRSSFMDYYIHHSPAERSGFLELGYERIGCLSAAETRTYFCRYLCPRFKVKWAPPFVRRAICSVVVAMWKSGAFKLLDKVAGLACATLILLPA